MKILGVVIVLLGVVACALAMFFAGTAPPEAVGGAAIGAAIAGVGIVLAGAVLLRLSAT